MLILLRSSVTFQATDSSSLDAMEWNGAPRTTLMHSRNHSDAASAAALRHLASSSTVHSVGLSSLPPAANPFLTIRQQQQHSQYSALRIINTTAKTLFGEKWSK